MEETKKGLNPLYLGAALVATLLIGAGIGFWLRPPTAAPERTVEVVVTATPNTQAAAQTDPEPTLSSGQATNTQANAPPTFTPEPPANDGGSSVGASEDAPAATPTPSIMDFLLSDARHIQGDPDAPVTMVEFSDFT